MKEIICIPGRRKKKNLKVAAYCRVSTKEESQQGSIDSQELYYEQLINENPDWIFAGIYVDYGSGLRRNGRDSLELMVEDACNGKIDYIITKSLSRFSRNTVDALEIIRLLKGRRIAMYFENEKIDTLEQTTEMELAIRCALAQEESRNMSENITWGYKRKFEHGDYFVKYKRFMGYRCENGNLEIIPEEAQTVRMIFYSYLMGKTLKQIKEELEKDDIKTATGKDNWSTYVIQKMLKNEKYAGCTLMQKTYCPNYMTGIRKINRGEVDQYFMTDTHPAIISRETYDKVQEEMKKRERIIYKEDGTTEISKKAYSSKYLFSNLLVCGHCGASYRRRTESGKVVWRCATRVEKGKAACNDSVTVNDEQLKTVLANAICDGCYDEAMVRNRVLSIKIFEDRLEIFDKNGNVI
ncbi:MAG: recombinase family protein [Lachnospiraceae bacterium]|nr:recombinase family protein [Lachnospiraceae bacterium]